MKMILMGAVALAILAGCDLTAEQRVGFRDAAIANIDAWNASGIDPLQASPAVVAVMMMTCNTATMLMTVINPAMSALGPAGADFCATAAHAVGRATVE